MTKLFKQSLIAHRKYMCMHISNKKKSLDFYNEMCYYIDNCKRFKLLPPAVKTLAGHINIICNKTPGEVMAREVYEMVYNSMKVRFCGKNNS